MSDLALLAIDALVRLAFLLDSITLRDAFAWFIVLVYAALFAVVVCVVASARMEEREGRAR